MISVLASIVSNPVPIFSYFAPFPSWGVLVYTSARYFPRIECNKYRTVKVRKFDLDKVPSKVVGSL